MGIAYDFRETKATATKEDMQYYGPVFRGVSLALVEVCPNHAMKANDVTAVAKVLTKVLVGTKSGKHITLAKAKEIAKAFIGGRAWYD